MKTTTLKGSLVILSALIAASGCAVSSEEDVATQGSELTSLTTLEKGSNTLATVTTSAGTKVMFLGGAEDELGVAIIGTVGRDDKELDAARDAENDLVRYYELLAKAPAPTALRDAAQRASEPRFTIDASDEGEVVGASTGAPSGTLVASTATQAAADFCDIYNYAYNGSGKFKYCWPNQYYKPWVKRKGDHMACRFDVIDGPTHVRARYKNASGWHTAISIWLQDNQFMQFNQHYKYAKRYRECTTVDNPGNKKLHFRVVGHDNLAALPFNPVVVSFP